MSLSEDRDVRRLISTVPPEWRLQAQVAVTGPVARLSEQVRAVRAESSVAWQGNVSVLYMTEYAALYRVPREVAEMVRDFQADFSADVVLDSATERSPDEIAAVALALPESTEFLRKVVLRRRSGDIAAMLAELRADSAARVLEIAVGRLCADVAPQKAAQVILHLRGMGASEPLDGLLAAMPSLARVTDLGPFLLSLADFRDDQSVRSVIDAMVAGQDIDPPDGDSGDADAGDLVDLVDRVAGVVESLQRAGRTDLVNDVEASVIAKFAATSQQYRLYALAFVFREHGLHDAVERIADKISESAAGDNTEMVLRFCDENREQAGSLLPVVLRKPKPAAAVRFAMEPRLDRQRDIIFQTVATWPSQDLIMVDNDLMGTSHVLADQFRAKVAEIAPQRAADEDKGQDKGEDLGGIVLWFLKHPNDKLGTSRANHVIAQVVAQHQPELLAELIRTVRDGKGWWLGTVRDEAARQVSEHYRIEDMTALITAAAARRCLPAVLRIAGDWLTRRPRGDRQVVQLVRALRAAGCEPKELVDMIRWAALRFNRPDGSEPIMALGIAETADLDRKTEEWRRAGWTVADIAEARRKEGEYSLSAAWVGAKRSMVPRFRSRPEPDPAPRQ